MAMSMHFLMSNTFKGAGDLVVDRLASRDRSRRSLVLVPDRFVLSTEKLVLDALGEGGTFDVEIMSFRRLTDIILRGIDGRYLSRDLSVMLMHRVITSCADKLTVYREGVNFSGFADEMYSAIGSMRNNMISPEALDGCISGLNASVRGKLNDLATLYHGYMHTLADEYIDSDSVMDALCEAIPHSDYFDDIDVYVMEYFFLTTKQREILRLILRQARRLNVALVMDEGYPNERLYPHALYSSLRNMAVLEGVEVSDEYQADTLAGPFEKISKYLYAYATPDKSSSEGLIEVYEADDVTQEVEGVAMAIVKAVREGRRYREIGVATSDAERYTPVIDRIFRRYSIPYFADVRKGLDTQPIARYLLGLLRLRLDNSITNLLSLAKNPLSSIPTSSVEDLENYLLKYGLVWTDLDVPFTLGLDEGDIYLAGAEEVRSSIHDLAFDTLPPRETVATYVEYLRKVSLDMSLCDKNQQIATSLRSLGRGTEADLVVTSYDRFDTILEDMMQILGDEYMSLSEFVDMLFSAVSGAKIGAIPSYLDSVYVGNCRESRYVGVSHLFVLGAGIENFPLEHSDSGIISSRERLALSQVGLDIEPDPSRRNLEEKLYAIQLLVKPTSKLVLSYNVTDNSKCSDVIRELETLFDDVRVRRYAEVSCLGENSLLSMPNEKVAIDVAVKQVESYLAGNISYMEALPYLTALNLLRDRGEVVDFVDTFDGTVPSRLFFTNGRTSVSQIENYFACPYQHYLKYGLYLKERDSSVRANLRGTFVHDLLCEYLRRYDSQALKEGEVDSRFDLLFEEIIAKTDYALMRRPSEKLSTLRLRGECLRLVRLVTSQINNSSYKPKHLELSIGTTDEYEYYVEFRDGERLGMRGSIDRVDVLDRDVDGDKPCIAIDYKTGAIHDKVKDLYYGHKIQVFLYADTLNKSGYTVKGLYYYPIKVKFSTETGKMQGYMLGDVDFAKDLDHLLGVGYPSRYIKATLTKDGDLARKDSYYTDTQLDTMIRYAKSVSTGAIEEIRSGVAIKSAYDSKTCEYCQFKNICLEVDSVRVVPTVDIDTVEEAMKDEQ